MLAAYTFGDVMWSMFVFFCWIIWFWLLITVFGDLFSRHDTSGWAKVGWTNVSGPPTTEAKSEGGVGLGNEGVWACAAAAIAAASAIAMIKTRGPC